MSSLEDNDYSDYVSEVFMKSDIKIHEGFIRNALSKLKINRTRENINRVALPPELVRENYNIDFQGIKNPKHREIVAEFCDVITKNFNDKILTNFFNNINDLTIRKNKLSIFSGNDGTYQGGKYNRITVFDNDSIDHELFHMASSSYKNGIYYDGLSQYYAIQTKRGQKFVSDIGDGINEGYTKLLEERYFGKKRDRITYRNELLIASRVEIIVGEGKMAEYYFENNLQGLIDHLARYSTPESAKKLITDFDYIHKSDNIVIGRDKKRINDCINYIKEYLCNCYMNKLLMELQRGVISEREMTILYSEFLSAFKEKMYVGPFKYIVEWGIEKEEKRIR